MPSFPPAPPAIRWTIGNVSPEGFAALQLSIWGAWHVFGADARYAVCYNSIALDRARELTRSIPPAVEWIDCNELLPQWMRAHLDVGMAEGVGWKLAPVRLFPDCYEIALDNDCILWAMPEALRSALSADHAVCVLAEDVKAYFGQFSDVCGDAPRNSGIRGTPARFDLEATLRNLLQSRACVLRTETDEQGLQVAAVSSLGPPLVVQTSEVTICSPFPPHVPHLGTCGAHFVGLNARELPWSYDGRPASEVRREHWHRLQDAIREKVAPESAWHDRFPEANRS